MKTEPVTDPDRFSGSTNWMLYLAFISYILFSMSFGRDKAIALIVTIGLHEWGHAWAFQWCGIPVKGIYFLADFGAATVTATDKIGRERDLLFATLAGPAFGFATAILFGGIWAHTRSPLCGQIAIVSIELNLLNLTPIIPFDGGKIALTLTQRLFGFNFGYFLIGPLQVITIWWTWGKNWFFTLLLALGFLQMTFGKREPTKILLKDSVTLGFGCVVVGLGLWLFRCYLILLDPQIENQGLLSLELFRFVLNVAVNTFKLFF